MNATAPVTSFRWRPNFLWVPMGLLMGTVSGAALGAVFLGATAVPVGVPSDILGSAMLGFAWGAVCGGLTGLIVGILLTFLVGSHLPLHEARDRGMVLAMVFTSPIAFAPLALLFPLPWALTGAVFAGLAGGLLSRRLAGAQGF